MDSTEFPFYTTEPGPMETPTSTADVDATEASTSIAKMDATETPQQKVKYSRKSLNLEQKLEILKELDLGLTKKSAIARRHKISKSCVSGIAKCRQELEAAYRLKKFGPSRKKLRRTKYDNIETALAAWMKEMSAHSEFVATPTILMDKGKHFAEVLGVSDFQCTTGWLHRFKERHDIKCSNTAVDTGGYCFPGLSEEDSAITDRIVERMLSNPEDIGNNRGSPFSWMGVSASGEGNGSGHASNYSPEDSLGTSGRESPETLLCNTPPHDSSVLEPMVIVKEETERENSSSPILAIASYNPPPEKDTENNGSLLSGIRGLQKSMNELCKIQKEILKHTKKLVQIEDMRLQLDLQKHRTSS